MKNITIKLNNNRIVNPEIIIKTKLIVIIKVSEIKENN